MQLNYDYQQKIFRNMLCGKMKVTNDSTWLHNAVSSNQCCNNYQNMVLAHSGPEPVCVCLGGMLVELSELSVRISYFFSKFFHSHNYC